jgi:hypothetical protein
VIDPFRSGLVVEFEATYESDMRWQLFELGAMAVLGIIGVRRFPHRFALLCLSLCLSLSLSPPLHLYLSFPLCVGLDVAPQYVIAPRSCCA